MPKKPKSVVIAVVSDVHCGSTVALSPEKIALDDGGEYVASKAQRWLWQSWNDYWNRVDAIRNSEGAELYTVFNGDVTEGDHHGTTQILSGNPTAQAAVVDACLKPVLALKPDRLFFVRGTEAHVGKSAAYEERIAKGLLKDKWSVVGDTDTGTASHWHLRMDVHGTRLDFAHHGRIGARPWTKGNGVLTLAVEIGYQHFRREEPHPHLAVRSHFHQYFDTGNAHPVRVVQMPAWQLHTAFGHRIAPDNLADVGGLIIVIKDGAFTVEPVLYAPARPSIWRASA